MADYSISTEVTLDDSKFSKGVKNAQNSSKKLSSVISNVIKGFGKGGLVGSITSAGLALGGIGLAVGTAIKAFQKISKTIGECSEAFKKQEKAEIALETAIKNSSVVTDTAVKSLKEYASELQRTTNLGDEEILPMMTQLIATGRTEAEVMQIIATASDMSATGTITFDTAVTQLNATLNGNIGRLGQQNAELKGLTEEELKNGKAVEILAGKYKGLATATVDTKKQLQNAIGDLKESFGAVFEKALSPMRKFFAEIIQGWADARKAKQEYEESQKAVAQGKGDIEDLQNVIAQRQKELDDLRYNLNALQTEDWGFPVEEAIRIKNEEIKQAERELEILNAQLNNKIEQQEIEKQQEEAENKRIETEKTIAELKEKYLKQIAEQEAKWRNIKDVTGEIVSAEEKIKFYQDSLVGIMTESGGQITKNNQYYKDQLAIIEELQKQLKPEEQESSDIWAKKIREQAVKRLEAEKEAELERLELKQATELEIFNVTSYYNNKLRELNRQRIEEERQQALESVKDYANAQEEKARINQYYDNELLDNNLKFIVDLKKQNTKIPNGFAEGFKKVISSAKEMSKKVIKIFSDVAKTVKSIFSTGKSIFSKIFEFNPDEALNNLLVFEDKVLTFFVETLPKLPQFFASAFQSIGVLLQNVMNSGGLDIIGQIVSNIIETAINNIPSILKMIGQLIIKIVNNLVPILDGVVPVLFDIVVGLVESLMKKLPQLIKVVVEFLSTMIQKIVKVLPSLIKAILPNLLKAILQLVKSLLKELPKIIKVIIDALPEIITTVIQALAEFFGNLKGSDIALFIKGIIQAVSQIANALIQNITQIVAELIPVMIQIVVELIKSIPDILKGLATGVWEGIKGVGEAVWGGIKAVGEGIRNIGASIISGIKEIFGFATGTNNAPKGLALVGEAGPELVRFRGGEQVLNNRNTQKLLATSGNAGNTFNVTFNNLQDTSAYAMMSQLRAYNRQMSINGVI